jgi:acetylornithine/N-succinyldiaminopimelate aminotransferase
MEIMQSQWIERGKQVIMHTYNSFPIVLDRGKGMYVWDIEGKCYLDFVSGIAVNCLGYKNETYIENVTNQLQKLTHCSNLYWNTPGVELAEMLIGNSCFD